MSSRRSRNGGRSIGTDVEPIIQVVAETARLDLVFQKLVGRGTTRVSTRMVRLSPTRSNSFSCRTRKQLDLQLGAHAGDFVEKDRAAVGRLESAGLVVDGPGECPLDVAEQLAFQQAFAQAPQLTRTYGPSAAD